RTHDHAPLPSAHCRLQKLLRAFPNIRDSWSSSLDHRDTGVEEHHTIERQPVPFRDFRDHGVADQRPPGWRYEFIERGGRRDCCNIYTGVAHRDEGMNRHFVSAEVLLDEGFD